MDWSSGWNKVWANLGLAAIIKHNLEAKQQVQEIQLEAKQCEEELQRVIDDQSTTIKELTDALKKGQLLGKPRVIAEDKKIIADAKEELWILGINTIGPLHEAREDIISLLDRGGNVRVLLLNPKSKAFEEREEFEEKTNEGQTSGRLRAEYEASVAICRDIVHFSRGRGTFELRIHDTYPSEVLVIADPKTDKAMLHVNKYPKEKLTRGYMGEHRLVLKNLWPSAFEPYVKEYERLWNKATKVDLEPIRYECCE